jgi:hypothetical protein
MANKVCSKCNAEKEISEFHWKNKKRGWRHGFCKDCHAAYRKVHYTKNRVKYLVKARDWNKKQTQALRKFIFEYLSSHPCVDCGKEDIRVLDFDHEKKKLMGIAQMIRNCYSILAVQREIKNCQVRCANCHRIKTFVRGKFWKEKMGL